MSARVSDSLLFDATDVDRAIVDLLPTLTIQERWPAFNAVRHLNGAHRIKAVGRTMALFQALTAEEEAATAVLQVLRRRKYPDADALNPKSHVHKNAVIPFFDGMTRVLATIQDPPELRFVLDSNFTPPRLRFAVQLPHPEHGMAWYYPDPPLHFQTRRSVDGGKTYSVETFVQGFSKVASEINAKTVGDYLRLRANFRNHLLYAGPDGYPDYQGELEARLQEFKRNVFALLRMFLFIEPYPEHQDFVVQAVGGFVRIVTNFSEPIGFD